MDDVTLQSFAWRRRMAAEMLAPISKAQKSQQTDTIVTRHAETMAKFQAESASQTENDVEKSSAAEKEHLRISESVLALILDFINDSSEVNYDRLLEFHKFDKVAIETVHSYKIETRNENLIHMLSFPASRKTLLLFGGSQHQTFCTHQPRAFLSSSASASASASNLSLPLAVCATTAITTSSSSTQFVLGDISGQISVYSSSGELKIGAKMVQDGAVTCLAWSPRHGVLVAGDEGSVQLLNAAKLVKPGGGDVEKVGGVKLVVADLPRTIRKSSTSGRPLAIVSMMVSGDEACLATETGGIYLLSLPDLNFKSLPISTSSCIKSILYAAPFLAISYHTQNTVLFSTKTSNIIDQLPLTCSQIAVKCGKYFVFSDFRRILIWSLANQSIVFDDALECRAISAISSDSFQILDFANNLTTFLINDRL